MRICQRLRQSQPTFSFEFFPPRDEAGRRELFETIRLLAEYRPDYVSVTYGAGGSTRRLTVELVCEIRNQLGIEAMAHLTAAGCTREQLISTVDQLARAGVENLLLLRGDLPPPEKSGSEAASELAFEHAADLIAFVRSRYGDRFCLAGACYPQKHPEAPDLTTDLVHLKAKVEAGAAFLITQLFFDNSHYFSFVARARELGIEVPILPGIMPITSLSQLKRFTSTCGVAVPPDLLSRLEAVADDPARVQLLGVEHATSQCRELLERGAPGIHFFTLNRSPATRRILDLLRSG